MTDKKGLDPPLVIERQIAALIYIEIFLFYILIYILIFYH